MRRFIFSIVFALVLSSSAYSQNFSGVITIQAENNTINETSTTLCYLKFPACKMEVSTQSPEGNGNYSIYLNNNHSNLTMVSNGAKTEVPLSSVGRNKYLENILIAIPTGKTTTLAGYEVEEITLKSTEGVIKCWVAKTLDIQFPSLINQTGLINALRDNQINGTPLKMEVTDFSGKAVFSQTIISIEQKDLSENTFQP